MARGSKKHIGAGAQGKGDGGGAMAEPVAVPPNAVLSNRDKTQDSRVRGQDGKWIQTEQLQDHELNQERAAELRRVQPARRSK